jgi:large subunit ribosomal protein L19
MSSKVSKKAPVKTAPKSKIAKASVATTRLESLDSLQLKNDLPKFKAGDKLVVKSKIKEGDKERVQAFEGIVIARNGRGIAETFTIRKVSAGVGVERVFPLHSPAIVSMEVKVEGFVRRGKLYYLRNLDGRAARIRDKNLKLLEAQGGVTADATVDATVAAAESAPTAPSAS